MQRQKRCKMCNSQKKGKTHLLFSHPDEKFLQIKNQLGREGLVAGGVFSFFIFANKEPRDGLVGGGVFLIFFIFANKKPREGMVAGSVFVSYFCK